MKHGFEFESETDTEVIPKLLKHLYDAHTQQNVSETTNSDLSFRELVEQAIQQLVSEPHLDFFCS
jgi:glucosamine 6-phosphate synthetase-like amidotransferase/phosphosugar isomerase protein